MDLKVWIWLLCKASSQDRHMTLKVGTGLHVVAVKAGQLIFGRSVAERELYIDGSTVYKIIKRMEADGLILVSSNNQFSIITIVDYFGNQRTEPIEDFEVVPEVTARKQTNTNTVTATDQPSDSDVTQFKKVEKVKKVKNVEKVEPAPALIVSDEFKRFVEWVNMNSPRVAKMKEPFTEDQFLRAKKEWTTEQITTTLTEMHNWEPLTRKNVSAYLTLNNWLKKHQKNESNRTTPAGGNGKLGTSAARTQALREW